MSPQRIQRKRTAGWRMPEGAVYVGRPTKWGNPYKVGESYSEANGKVYTAKHAVELFELHVGPMGNYEYDDASHNLDELRGKDLSCWCPLSSPCHADVLLRLANEGES